MGNGLIQTVTVGRHCRGAVACEHGISCQLVLAVVEAEGDTGG